MYTVPERYAQFLPKERKSKLTLFALSQPPPATTLQQQQQQQQKT